MCGGDIDDFGMDFDGMFVKLFTVRIIWNGFMVFCPFCGLKMSYSAYGIFGEQTCDGASGMSGELLYLL
jgi:hypothetical protein